MIDANGAADDLNDDTEIRLVRPKGLAQVVRPGRIRSGDGAGLL